MSSVANRCFHFLATGKTLEEIDILFARSPEVRERLEAQKHQRRRSFGSVSGPAGRRASTASVRGAYKSGAAVVHEEKV